jgi:hypothetical protein
MKIAELGPLHRSAQRPATWQRDRDPMLAYLRAGRLVRAARSLAVDDLDPERPAAVPITFQTDGCWVWSGAIAYYAEHHDIPVDPELIEHARRRGFAVGEVSAAEATEALAALDADPADQR